MSQSLIGQTLKGRYKIVKQLGAGGFGDTYIAYDLDLPGQPMRVIKHIAPEKIEPEELYWLEEQFMKEAKLLYKLGSQHEQIPTLHAYFQSSQQFYLVQEYIEGHDLSEEIYPGQIYSETYTLDLLGEILSVLSYVHECGVIHRDIKPENILRRKSDGKLFLIDFGAVKEIGYTTEYGLQNISSTVAIGTQGYMPIEQAAGRPRLSSDVYAVGMIGVFCLTGKYPSELYEDPRTGDIQWKEYTQASDNTRNFVETMVKSHFPDRYETAAVAYDALQSLLVRFGSQSTDVSVNNQSHEYKDPKKRSTSKILQISKNEKENLSYITNNNIPKSSKILAELNQVLKEFCFETVRVDKKGTITKRIHQQTKYFQENLSETVTMDLVMIPKGEYLMGDKVDGPRHKVRVPAFAMGKYPVTQAQWQEIMHYNPSNFRGDHLPVEFVSWHDAVEFCEKMSDVTGREYRLPSEAEWEYACRSGTSSPFYYGKQLTNDLANFQANSSDNTSSSVDAPTTVEVGSFPPNNFGLYDMHGNVREWCLDYWHSNYGGLFWNTAPKDGSAWLIGGDSNFRVVRGGCFKDVARYCRSAHRMRMCPGVQKYRGGVGFRVVLPYPQ